jgi:2-polyprenyl-3-methyl-5-hydroxy-6-metoxy-1,4-benzoquinol methylase
MINFSNDKNEFDAKAATWDTPEKIERAQIMADAILAESVELDSAFEYGCGTGLVSLALREKIKKIVLADISDGMLDVVRQKIKNLQLDNCSSVKLDLTIEPPLSEQFNLIYSLQTLHHIPNTRQIIEVLYGMLKDGGCLFIADLDLEDGSFHGPGFDGHNGFSREELKSMALAIGFRSVEFRSLYDIIKRTTSGESRTYPLFLMIAAK